MAKPRKSPRGASKAGQGVLIQLRCPKALVRLIDRARAIKGQTRSHFMRQAAEDEAKMVISSRRAAKGGLRPIPLTREGAALSCKLCGGVSGHQLGCPNLGLPNVPAQEPEKG